MSPLSPNDSHWHTLKMEVENEACLTYQVRLPICHSLPSGALSVIQEVPNSIIPSQCCFIALKDLITISCLKRLKNVDWNVRSTSMVLQ